MPKGFTDQFELVEGLHGPEDGGRVGALAAARFEPAPFLAPPEQGIQQGLFETAVQQSRPKLAEHRVMKALVGQLQTQRVLPVNPGADGLGRLPITQIFHELHDADQGELPGVEGGLALDGIDSGEQVIVKERAQLIA